MQLTQGKMRSLCFADMTINNHHHQEKQVKLYPSVPSSSMHCEVCKPHSSARECYQQLHDPTGATVAPAHKAGFKTGHASMTLAASTYKQQEKAL